MRNGYAITEMKSQEIVPVQFDGTIVAGEQKVSATVLIDTDGVVLTVKQGDIRLPRDCWVSASGHADRMILIAYSHSYEDWLKKLKFESKNPGQTKSDLALQTYAWNIAFKAQKLGPETVQQIQKTLEQVDLDIYVQSQKSPELLQFARCPTCSQPIDVTPYPDCDTLFCNRCSRLFSDRFDSDSVSYGICSQCTYYTKLKKAEQKICYPCDAKNTFTAFFYSMLTTAGIVVLNIATLVFLNRYFPVLLLIAGVSFVWSMIKLVGVLTLGAARKATGTTPMERAIATLRKGRTDDAMRIIDTIPNAERNPGIILNLTRGLINQKNYPKAMQFADMLIDQYPNFQFGYSARLEALVLQGATQDEVQAASEALDRVVARNTLRTARQLQWLRMIPT